LSDHGRVEHVFKACYSDQWQEYKDDMTREDFNPSLAPLSQTDQDRSRELLEFLDTDEFNQACKDVGAEASGPNADKSLSRLVHATP
jgi:hypothetical protein